MQAREGPGHGLGMARGSAWPNGLLQPHPPGPPRASPLLQVKTPTRHTCATTPNQHVSPPNTVPMTRKTDSGAPNKTPPRCWWGKQFDIERQGGEGEGTGDAQGREASGYMGVFLAHNMVARGSLPLPRPPPPPPPPTPRQGLHRPQGL